MIVFYKIPMEVWVVAPPLNSPMEEEGERLDAAESTRSEGMPRPPDAESS